MAVASPAAPGPVHTMSTARFQFTVNYLALLFNKNIVQSI